MYPTESVENWDLGHVQLLSVICRPTWCNVHNYWVREQESNPELNYRSWFWRRCFERWIHHHFYVCDSNFSLSSLTTITYLSIINAKNFRIKQQIWSRCIAFRWDTPRHTIRHYKAIYFIRSSIDKKRRWEKLSVRWSSSLSTWSTKTF